MAKKKVVAKAKKKAQPKKTVAKKTVAKKAVAKQTIKKAVKKLTPKKDEKRVLVNTIIEGILDKKGKNIVCLDLRKIENRVSDYFIITEADSTTQVHAIADSIEDSVKKNLKYNPFHSEGFQNSEWILIDYVDVVVHIFQGSIRQLYNLEGLWADAEEIELKLKY